MSETVFRNLTLFERIRALFQVAAQLWAHTGKNPILVDGRQTVFIRVTIDEAGNTRRRNRASLLAAIERWERREQRAQRELRKLRRERAYGALES